MNVGAQRSSDNQKHTGVNVLIMAFSKSCKLLSLRITINKLSHLTSLADDILKSDFANF